MQQPLISASNPIVKRDLTMEEQFRDILNRLTDALPIIGTGSPEGVVEAKQFSLYIDEDGLTGNIEYRKMQANIGGDKTQGWLQV